MIKQFTNLITKDSKLEQIKDYLRVLDSAMERHDRSKLSQIIDPSANLMHITGYIQNNQDWISQIGYSYFNYKRVNSSNITYTQKDNTFIVSYDWTIVNSQTWKFHNILKLEMRNNNLMWVGTNHLTFR